MTSDQKTYRIFKRIQRLNSQRHLYSVRAAFVATMPIMIVGAYAVVINQMPLPAYQAFMESIFGERWRMLGAMAFNGTTQIVTLMVVFSICANLVMWYNTHRHTQGHPVIGGMIGLACYTVVSIPVEGIGGLPFSMTGVTGLFVAMVVSVVSAEGYVRLSSRQSANLHGDDPSPVLPQAFAAIVPAVIIIGLFAVFRVLLVFLGVEDPLDVVVLDFLRKPYENSSDSMLTAQLFNISTHFMWLFGIHGNNVLDEVAQTIFVPAMEQNVAAVAAGAAAPNLVTKTLYDVFVYMGGSGTTLALLIALVLFGRSRSNRILMRFAAPNALFNINEPLIFGIPIVLNPIYAVPFVITPVVMLTTTVAAMELGLVPYTIREVSWATPIFFSGYAATGSFSGVVLQAVNLALAVLIYRPFVRLAEEVNQLQFKSAFKELNRVVADDYSGSRKLIRRVDEVGALARRLANQMDNRKPGEMYMVYQPIVDARDPSLHSVEALLRWKHPQYGLINPMVTVALAEETGRIDKLGLWIMEQSIRQRAEWNKQGLPDFHVSVNISTRQLNAPDFHRKVVELLHQYKVPGSQIQIEITETAALVENHETGQNLAKLHQHGITIAMDDFGVGHSSLLYLRTQPISTLKIDGSLSREIIRQPANLDIIATIRDLCDLMDVSMIVEFVDNQEQLEKLLGIGTHLIQGYLFSKPLLPGELPAFMEELGRR